MSAQRNARDAGSGFGVAALIVDSAPQVRDRLRTALASCCALVEAARDPRAGEALRRRYRFDLLVVAVDDSEGAALAWIEALRARHATLAVIAMADDPTVAMVVAALRAGAVDFLAGPVAREELRSVVRRSLRRRAERVKPVKPARSVASTAVRIPVAWRMAEVERWHCLKVLAQAGGNKSRAARSLGISRKTLERKLKTWAAAVAAGEEADGAALRG